MDSKKPRKSSNIFGPGKVKFQFETPETATERTARLRREEADAALARRKDFILFLFSLVVVGLITLCAVYAIILTPQNAAWAHPILTLVIGGLIGYQTGKAQPKADK